MSHKIKQLALDLNIAIILLSQVNREGSKAEYGLELYHLRDSGDIENDADVILLMWPTDKDLEESRRTDASGTYALMQYKIAKNREGQRDLKGQFKFFNQYGRFY
jgi:replicative DNA helicase